jgi:hypothetical protein
MKGPNESYHQAMEKLVFGDSQRYEPYTSSRKDYPTMTLQGGPSYSAENNEIYFESLGPAGGGPYSLVFILSDKRVQHAYGPYHDQQAASDVEDIEFP